MRVLYITEPGAELRKNGGRMLVLKSGQVLQELLLRDMDRMVLLTQVQLSAGITKALLEEGIPVMYCSRNGKYFGILTSGDGDLERWLVQVKRWQDLDYRVAQARAIVETKIRHQRSILRRQGRNHSDTVLTDAAGQLTSILNSLRGRENMEQLLGDEGQAAAVYFGFFATVSIKQVLFSIAAAGSRQGILLMLCLA